MATIDETKARILRVSTKKGLTGKEIAAKLQAKHAKENYSDGRTIGRPLGQLIKERKLKNVGSKSRPVYAKV